MFLHLCVILFTGGGSASSGVCTGVICIQGESASRGVCIQGDLYPRGSASRRVCIQGRGLHPRGICFQGGWAAPPIGHYGMRSMSGRHTSYRTVFLSNFKFLDFIITIYLDLGEKKRILHIMMTSKFLGNQKLKKRKLQCDQSLHLNPTCVLALVCVINGFEKHVELE